MSLDVTDEVKIVIFKFLKIKITQNGLFDELNYNFLKKKNETKRFETKMKEDVYAVKLK